MTARATAVVVEGADAISYLDSQCTQDLSTLPVGGRVTTLVLDPTGTIVTLAEVARTAETSAHLAVSVGTADATIARLGRFAIRADVRFSTAEGDVVGEHDELARIKAGVPGSGELSHGLVPHALDTALLASCVSFTKGCYPGQELVARMHSRGATPPYVLRRLVSDDELGVHDAVGDPSRTGEVTSAAASPRTPRWHALCVLHRRDAEGDHVEVRSSERTVLALLV